MRMQNDRRRVWWAAGIIAGVLVLGVAGVGGYFYWKQSQEGNQSDSSSSTGGSIPVSLGEAPAKTEEYEETPAKLLAAQLNAALVGDKREPSISGPFGKVGEYKFFVRNDNYYGSAAKGTQAQAESNLAMIRGELKQQNYKETIRQKGEGTEPFDALSTGNDVLCEVYSLKPTANDKKKQYETGVLCADAKQFKETSELVESYVKSYQKATSADISNKGFYGLRVSSSPESGYRRAAVNITGDNQDVSSGYLLVFYQMPDGVWRYFTSTQGLVACSKYNTQELLKAFRGEPCEAGGEASAVGANN